MKFLSIILLVLLRTTSIAADSPKRASGRTFEDQCSMIIASADHKNTAVRLHEFFKVDWAQNMADHPGWATYIGYPGHDHELTDQSLEAIERRRQQLHLRSAVLDAIDRSKLDEQDKLNYDLFRTRLEMNIGDSRFRKEYLQISQLSGPQQNLAQLLSMMPINSREESENFLARLKAIPQAIDDIIILLDLGKASGITPPKVTLGEVPQQIQNQIVDDPAEAPLLQGLKKIESSFTAEERDKIKEKAFSIYRDEVVPALQKLHSFVTNEYIPNCRQSIGLSEMPDGKEWYAHRVSNYTTTDLTPDEIYNIGLSEVARIRIQMDSLIASTEFDGTFEEFCEFLRTDPQFYFDKAEDLLAAYRDIGKRADPELIKLFGRLPRLPYGVEPVPAYAEKSQTTAYYQGGSLEAGRPGIFYANTYDLKSRPKWEMEALTLHEAVPGHHLQTSLAKELTDLPEFRRNSWFTAYGEGWALYTEGLGYEMGFYKDPYSKFGQLTYEMWRACRLVIDVGLHAKGWTRQQAIDYFTKNLGKADHDIEVEVDRYIVWPGQALAYKIGELKIKELRARAKETLGDAFDIRAFHDEILGHGALPLSVLEDKIDSWIVSTLADVE